MHENREISSAPWSNDQGRSAKATSRTADMHALEKSDCAVVPVNQPNKEWRPSAEVGEGRAQTKENIVESHMHPTQSGKRMSQGLDGVRKAAKESKQQRFTALLHHLSIELLRESFYALQRRASPGVDGVTWSEYESGLEDRLIYLHSRVHGGVYRAKPSRRVFIPKADGRQRPLGIAALEDKIVQQAVVTILNQIYEVDFKGFSYGFRPGRSPHQALDALTVGIERRRVNWVLDADLRSFFDTLKHAWLMQFIEHRVADKRIVRLIQKWLNAGVLEDGKRIQSEVGTVQGGSISPLLANIYLHYVFDLWIQRWRQKQARGDVIVVRFADDFVVGFEHRVEAERFLTELRERFAYFGLELHPEKTRLIEFGRFARSNREKRGDRGAPGSFNFLGFTHSCGKTRKGGFTVLRQTMRKRWQAKLKAVKAELKARLHDPIPEVGKYLRAVVLGHVRYYGVPMNGPAICAFRRAVGQVWWRVLRRRSQGNHLPWRRMGPLLDTWLPPARLCHPYPSQRLRVTTRGGSRMR